MGNGFISNYKHAAILRAEKKKGVAGHTTLSYFVPTVPEEPVCEPEDVPEEQSEEENQKAEEQKIKAEEKTKPTYKGRKGKKKKKHGKNGHQMDKVAVNKLCEGVKKVGAKSSFSFDIIHNLYHKAMAEDNRTLAEKYETEAVKAMSKWVATIILDDYPFWNYLSYEMFVQGCAGVIMAMKRFDKDLSSASSYCRRYIKAQIREYLSSDIYGVGRYYFSISNKIYHCREDMQAEFAERRAKGEENVPDTVTLEMIAERLNMSIKTVKAVDYLSERYIDWHSSENRYYAYVRNKYPGIKPYTPDGDINGGDTDNGGFGVSEPDNFSSPEGVQAAADGIIRMYLGMNGAKRDMTENDISKQTGMSEEEVKTQLWDAMVTVKNSIHDIINTDVKEKNEAIKLRRNQDLESVGLRCTQYPDFGLKAGKNKKEKVITPKTTKRGRPRKNGTEKEI